MSVTLDAEPTVPNRDPAALSLGPAALSAGPLVTVLSPQPDACLASQNTACRAQSEAAAFIYSCVYYSLSSCCLVMMFYILLVFLKLPHQDPIFLCALLYTWCRCISGILLNSFYREGK